MENLKWWVRGTQTMPDLGQQKEYMGPEKILSSVGMLT